MSYPTIIAMSGRKSAGKNTVGAYVQQWFTKRANKAGLYAYDPPMECSFADTLKDFCIETLGLTNPQCNGRDEEKNSATHFLWDDVPDFFRWKFGNDILAKDLVLRNTHPNEMMRIFFADRNINHKLLDGRIVTNAAKSMLKSGPMSGREVMQLFGTDLIRQTFGNVWAGATIRRIKNSNKKIAVIVDNRFPNEVEAVLAEPHGFVIRLTRSPFGNKDVHPSESALDDFDWNRDKCFVLDNQNMSLERQNESVSSILEQIIEIERSVI